MSSEVPGRITFGSSVLLVVNCGVGNFLNILPEGDVYPCHVLATAEFRLGNVREQSLEELCAAGGRLARLQALDFRKLAGTSPGWQPLSRAGSCLGALYERAQSAGAPALGLSQMLS